MVNVGGSLEGVGTGLGDGVHTATDEVGLTYIKRRNHNLHFLNRIDGDRRTTSRKLLCKTKVIVEVRTVNGEVGRTSVRSGECHSVSTIRGKPCDIRDASADSRQSGDLGVVDVGGGASLLYGELRVGGGDNNSLGKHLGVIVQLGVEVVGLGELEGDIREGHGLIAKAAYLNFVRTT